MWCGRRLLDSFISDPKAVQTNLSYFIFGKLYLSSEVVIYVVTETLLLSNEEHVSSLHAKELLFLSCCVQ